MSRLRVIAVDDEPLALERLRILLDQEPQVELVARANGCIAGVQAAARFRPDLLLLDVRMRDGTAFDLLNGLPEGLAPMVAFVTAYPRYACRAFDLDALDYLLKPVEPQRLQALLRKARDRRDLLDERARGAELKEVIAQLREDQRASDEMRYEADLWIRQRGTDLVRVSMSEIDWISAQDDYACIHARGREHLLRISLDRLMASLDPRQFARVHRSIIVRIDRVSRFSLKRLGVREVLLRDGTTLPVGRVYARSLRWRSGAPPLGDGAPEAQSGATYGP